MAPSLARVLDVSGCGNSNGTRVQTWENGVGVCDGGAGQKWQFMAASTTGTAPSSGTGKIVGGYYPWWVDSPVRLINVPSVYNLIYLFAATPTGGSAQTGAVALTLPADTNGAATNWAADIQTARNVQHRKIMLSVGGSGFAMLFPNRAYSQTFLASVEALYNSWGGFDDLDWDTFEGVSKIPVHRRRVRLADQRGFAEWGAVCESAGAVGESRWGYGEGAVTAAVHQSRCPRGSCGWSIELLRLSAKIAYSLVESNT
jgi:hypothetical protein